MAGFMLSGSGIKVFVFGNMGLGWGGWENIYISIYLIIYDMIYIQIYSGIAYIQLAYNEGMYIL